VAIVRDDPTPLLPLTYSDEISIDATDTDTAATATEGAFNFKLVFQQMLPSTNEAPSISFEQHSRVISMDLVLARLPHGRNVRLYPVTTRNNVMWEAVQQAFAFFSTNEGAAAVASAGAVAGSGGTAAAAGVLVGAVGMSESSSSIQSLNLTQSFGRRQLQQPQQGVDSSSTSSLSDQQQQLDGNSSSAAAAAAVSTQQLGLLGGLVDVPVPLASAAGDAGSGSSFGAAVARKVSRISSAAAADSPTRSSTAAAAAAGSQLFGVISNLGMRGGAGTGNPALSGLTDILEIRTDVDSVRMISSPDQPPQVLKTVSFEELRSFCLFPPLFILLFYLFAIKCSGQLVLVDGVAALAFC
jgi:hypothetical protein